MIPSFLSAFAAMLISAGAFTCLTWWHSEAGSGWVWPNLFMVAVFVAARFILPVWVCALWPLYRFTPAGSPLWHPPICVSVSVAVGVLLYFGVFGSSIGWQVAAYISRLHFLVGALGGAAAGVVACACKRRRERAA